MSVCWRVTDAVFWLLALAAQLPTAGALWLAARLVNLADTFGAVIGDLVRWRNGE
jgi:hypothetical protein